MVYERSRATLYSFFDERKQRNSSIQIGIIDGPVDLTPTDFKDSNINVINNAVDHVCQHTNPLAFIHGTFIMGIISGERGMKSLAICPDCKSYCVEYLVTTNITTATLKYHPPFQKSLQMHFMR